MYRAGHYRRWRLSLHWSPTLGGERRPRVPAPYPHVGQTPPPSFPRKPRVGDEQGLLIGGHTHHQSATNLNIPGQLSTPLCQGSCPQTVRVSAPGPARVRLSSHRIDRKLRYEVENRVLPVFYLHLPPFYLHLVPSLVAKCTGKRPQKTPKLAVKWPGSAGREQSARAPGIG